MEYHYSDQIAYSRWHNGKLTPQFYIVVTDNPFQQPTLEDHRLQINRYISKIDVMYMAYTTNFT